MSDGTEFLGSVFGNPKLPDEDFDEAVRIAQAEFSQFLAITLGKMPQPFATP